eukprot:scaffold602_cov298-Pinguiococcus_pyrenoidosus.AAC.21
MYLLGVLPTKVEQKHLKRHRLWAPASRASLPWSFTAPEGAPNTSGFLVCYVASRQNTAIGRGRPKRPVMKSTAALVAVLCVLHAPCSGFVAPGRSPRCSSALLAKKKSGQKQADLLKQLEAAKRQKAEEERGVSPASDARSAASRELPTPNKDWRQSGATEAVKETAQDYDEMEALLGAVDGVSDPDALEAAQDLSGEIEPRDSWSHLEEPSGAPISWMDAVVRGGPLYVLADPRGGSGFAQVVRDLNARIPGGTPGSVVAISVDTANDLRKLAKKSGINLSKIQLLSDPAKRWLLAHKCVGPDVQRLTTKLFIIDLKGGGGVVREVVVLDDMLSVADVVAKKIAE